MRVVGLAAALLAAAAAAAPVQCGAVDALWQDEAAVVGNFPECESFYDGTSPEQTADIDPGHPEMKRLVACRRQEGTSIFKCTDPSRRSESLTYNGHATNDVVGEEKRADKNQDGNWPPGPVEQSTQGNWPPDRRGEQSTQGNWPPDRRGEQSTQGNWPPDRRENKNEDGNWPPGPVEQR
ncbi:hypothetical protein IF2G_11131 [Cordyceps javanica]|nr:hypothetical protein IF2G_11131 [Cordyceps javanica]